MWLFVTLKFSSWGSGGMTYQEGLGKVSMKPTACLPGETSQEEWKRRVQENSGPWGELATDNIILTVPTANLRALEEPEPLLRLWDDVMRAVARLGAEPFPLRLPQRIVADVQISVGGYAVRACCPQGPACLPLHSHALGSQLSEVFFQQDVRDIILAI